LAEQPNPVEHRVGIRCSVWGVLNVTPDSFSDGGRFLHPQAACEHALRMRDEGADVIDVGGESSRPRGATYGAGASYVAADHELARVLPVIERLARESIPLSIDTVKPEVARAALAAGARIVNDVSCAADPALLAAVAEAGAELVLMHTRADGRIDESTTGYVDVVGEVLAELESAVERAAAAGVDRSRIWIDPGIGFAKTAFQSTILLGNLDAFVATGYPVLVGASRKSFIAKMAGEDDPEHRLGGSIAAVTAAVLAGVQAVRVHDVYESAQAVRIAEAMRAARRSSA
jgi:dihydropteroate synthase